MLSCLTLCACAGEGEKEQIQQSCSPVMLLVDVGGELILGGFLGLLAGAFIDGLFIDFWKWWYKR